MGVVSDCVSLRGGGGVCVCVPITRTIYYGSVQLYVVHTGIDKLCGSTYRYVRQNRQDTHVVASPQTEVCTHILDGHCSYVVRCSMPGKTSL